MVLTVTQLEGVSEEIQLLLLRLYGFTPEYP